MDYSYCSDCKRNTVCSECGLVLESSSIDETSECRMFADDSVEHDPNHVGGPVNPLLADAGHSTVISNAERLQNMAFKTIDDLADRLNLVTTIKDRASEMYKRLIDQKCRKGRNSEALAAACIYIACRQEGKSRTLKEISSIVSGATKTQIGRAEKFIEKQMGESIEMGTINAKDYPRRFCSNLGMSNEEVKVVLETVQKAGDFDIRRSPISIAAAVIFMITQLSYSKKPLRDISIATTVAEGTIRSAYKDLYPHAAKVIPEWYAKEKDLNDLFRPKA